MVISDGEAAIIDAVRFTDVFTNFAHEKMLKLNMYLIHIYMLITFQVVAISQLQQVQRIIYRQKMQKKLYSITHL